jgi:hypothetical protein
MTRCFELFIGRYATIYSPAQSPPTTTDTYAVSRNKTASTRLLILLNGLEIALEKESVCDIHALVRARSVLRPLLPAPRCGRSDGGGDERQDRPARVM